MKEPYVLQEHRWGKLKFLPWPVCVRCGLLYLSNPFTAWSVKHGCNNEDHPSYEAVRSKLTAPR